MKADPHQLATTFKDAFCKALESNERNDLLKMWQSVTDKTWFYEKTLMPTVAQQLGWELHIEKFRCDFMFLDERAVPLVAVESENAHETAGHEVNCLCSLAAPLKVLLLSCDWQGSEKAKYLPKWAEIIRTHHSVVSLDCLYLIVVGEWDEPKDARLEYSFTLLDTEGTVWDEIKHTMQALPELNNLSVPSALVVELTTSS